MKAINYWSKSYHIEGVRVTKDNIREVAGWCRGDVKDAAISQLDSPDGQLYIDFVGHDDNHRPQRVRAFIGDWVTMQGSAFFRVYTDEVFQKRFWTHTENLTEDDRYANIYQMVRSVVAKQDACTYYGDSTGMDLAVEETTKRIAEFTKTN